MKRIILIAATLAAPLISSVSSGGLPDLTPVTLRAPAAVTNAPYPTVDVSWAVNNQGSDYALGWWDGLYISTNWTTTADAQLLWSSYNGGPLGPGETQAGSAIVVLPIRTSGTYYLSFRTDLYNSVIESNEDNNTIVTPLTFQATLPDLAPAVLQLTNWYSGPPNPSIDLVWAITNMGPGAASGHWVDAVYFSTSAAWVPDSGSLDFLASPTTVPAGEVYWQTNKVVIPVTSSGTYYLVFKTDIYNSIYESNLSNNVQIFPVTFTIQPPDLTPLTLQAPTNVVALVNPYVNFVWGVTNQGTGPAIRTWPDGLYLSTNAVLDESADRFITYFFETGPIAPGDSYWETNSFQVPVTRSGTYYVIFEADVQNGLGESNFSNNAIAIPISFTIQQPDLTPIMFEVPAAVTNVPNPSLTVSWGVTNQGNGTTSAYWNDQVYLSKDAVLDSTDIPVCYSYEYSQLDAGKSYWRTNVLGLPVTQSGSYYLIFKTDTFNSVNESDTNNNTLAMPIALTIQPPNLAPIALQVPAVITSPPNPMTQVVWGVTNQGAGAATGNWSDRLYLSSDAQWDPTDSLVTSSMEWGPVPPGGIYWRTNQVTLPVTQNGNYFLIFKANADEYSGLIESDLSDNTKTVPVSFKIQPPDLAPVISQLPNAITGAPNTSFTVIWGITNQGPGAAAGTPWFDYVYLSTNTSLSGTESPLAYVYENDTLAAGAVAWHTNTARLPAGESGNNYFIVRANQDHWLFESDYGNNEAAVPVQLAIQKPDLSPVAFQAPSLLTAPPYPPVTLVWGVTNQGAGAAVPSWAWYDHLYVSTNPIWDASALDVYSRSEQGPVDPGQSYWRTNTLGLPLTNSGTYYLFLKVDPWQNLFESNTNNNSAFATLTYTASLPDLAPVGLHGPSVVTGPPNPVITYSWGVTNQGAGAAIPHNSGWLDVVSLSTDPAVNPSTSSIFASYQWGPLPAGQTYWQTNTIRIPVTQSGTYYLWFNTDANNALIEPDYSNNVASVPITFNILPPDLAPVALQAPATITGPPYPTVTVVWGVTNQGTGPAIGANYWYDQLTLSKDPVWSWSGTVLSSWGETGPIASGGTYWRTNTVRMPITQSGAYYLIFRANYDYGLYESNETNNILVLPVTFDIQPPDLVPVTTFISNVVTSPPMPSLTLIWGITNQGTGAAIGRTGWSEAVYLSENAAFDRWLDFGLASQAESGPIEPGGVSWHTNNVNVPVTDSGTNYLIFAINQDSYNRLYESNYSNDIVVVPVSFNIQKPDLAPFTLRVPRTITGPPNPMVTFIWGVTNQGIGAATAKAPITSWSDTLYISNSDVPGQQETYVCTAYESGSIPPGGTYWITNTARVPVRESGTYYFILQADANSRLYESSYSNNTLAVPVTFNIQPPDLAPLALQAPTVATSAPNPKLIVAWGVTNLGIGTAEGPWSDGLYLSTNRTFDSTARLLKSSYESGPAGVGGAYWRTNAVTLPVLESGTYYLIFQANVGNGLYESNFTNNFIVQSITLTIVPPDLAPITLRAPALIASARNPEFEIVWGVTNNGPGYITRDQSWGDNVYLSTAPTMQWNSTLIASDWRHGSLAPGETYWHSQVVRLWLSQSGIYYLILKVNEGQSLFEADESNNIVVVPIRIQIDPPDLMPISFQAPAVVNSSPHPIVQFTWGVTNAGPAIGSDPWLDSVYLAKNPTLDSSANSVIGTGESGPTPAAGSYWRTQSAWVPVEASGDYYFIFQTDTYNSLGESNYSNNTVAVPVHFNISMPDLAPIAFLAPTNVNGPANPSLTLVWGVTNQGPGDISQPANYWDDRLYLSTNPVLDVNVATFLTTQFEAGPLPSGGSYWRTNTIRVPVTQDGTYYLFFENNSGPYQRLAESDDTNNEAVAKVTFHLSPPDLKPFAFQCPVTIDSEYPNVDLVWGVTNQEVRPTEGISFQWVDSVSLRTTNTANGSSQLLQSWSWSQIRQLAPDGSYWSTNRIQLPIVSNGTYSLTLTVDAYNDLGETVQSNNSASILLSANLVPPDVAPVFLTAVLTTNGSQNLFASIVWGVTNRGPGSAQTGSYYAWYDRLYLSANPSLDGSSLSLGEWSQNFSMPGGASYWRTNSVHLPAWASGDYYMILRVDTYNALHEPDASNHVAITPVRINVPPRPDLAPVLFLAPSVVTGAPNPSLTLVWGVTNQGSGPAQSDWPWSDGVYLSSIPMLDGTETAAGFFDGTNSLTPGGIYWRTNTAKVPVTASGSYYLIFRTANNSAIAESDYANNTAVVPITFELLPPDLAPVAFQAPASLAGAPDPGVTIIVGVTNQGVGPALPADDALYLSVTPFLGPSSRLAATWSRTNTIPSGGSYWLTNFVRLPAVDSGQYFLVFETDPDNPLLESDILNNDISSPIKLTLSLPPDLAVTEFQAPRWLTGPANPAVQLAWHVLNKGLGPAEGSWSDAVLLFTNLDSPPATVLGRFLETNSVAVGEEYCRTNTVTLPLTQSGTVYVRFCADVDNDLYEWDEDNNVAQAMISFYPTTAASPRVGAVKLNAGGSFDLAIYGSIGAAYTIQTSIDLANWVGVCSFTCTNTPTWIQDVSACNSPEGFYRVAPYSPHTAENSKARIAP